MSSPRLEAPFNLRCKDDLISGGMAEGRDSKSICKLLTGISFQDPNQSNPTSHPTFDGVTGAVCEIWSELGQGVGRMLGGACGSDRGSVVNLVFSD